MMNLLDQVSLYALSLEIEPLHDRNRLVVMLIATHQRARVIVGHRTVRVVKHSCVSLVRLCDMFRALLLRQCLVNTICHIEGVIKAGTFIRQFWRPRQHCVQKIQMAVCY